MTHKPVRRYKTMIVIAGLFVATATMAANQNEGRVHVMVEDSRVSIQASNARVDHIVKAVGSKLGFESIVIGDYSNSPLRNLSIDSMDPEAALNRVLDGTNSMIVYRSSPTDATASGHATTAERNQPAIAQVWLLESGKEDAALQSANREAPGLMASASLDPALDSNDVRARSKAFMRLANRVDQLTGDSSELDWILARLSSGLNEDPAPLVRSRAASTLGQLGDPRAVQVLINALSDTHPSVRYQAINALGRIRDAAAVEALGKILRATDSTEAIERSSAALALWNHDDPAALSYLRSGRSDPSAEVRRAAKNKPVSNPAQASQTARGTRAID